MNKAAVNIHVQVLMGTYVFISPGKCLGVELLGQTIIICFIRICFSNVAIPFCISASNESVSDAPLGCCHLALSVVKILATLVDV